jgi:hypothetical protein
VPFKDLPPEAQEALSDFVRALARRRARIDAVAINPRKDPATENSENGKENGRLPE